MRYLLKANDDDGVVVENLSEIEPMDRTGVLSPVGDGSDDEFDLDEEINVETKEESDQDTEDDDDDKSYEPSNPSRKSKGLRNR